MTKKKSAPPVPVQNVSESENSTVQMQNGLAEATIGIGGAPGNSPFGFPFNQGTGFTPQVETTNPMFKNLRYYFVSNMRQLLSQTYAEIGLVQTLCDVPVDDAFRGGITFNSRELDEEQLLQLQEKMAQDGDLDSLMFANKMNRLFGGSAVLILTDQDPEEPLDINALADGGRLEFRGLDMWELSGDMLTNADDDESTLFQMMFNPTVSDDVTYSEYFDYYGVQVHRSRLLIMKGIEAPSFVRPRLRGWGLSVVETLVRALNQYLKNGDLLFEVMDEFKVDVYKMKNLINTLSSADGTRKIQQRVQIANQGKNYQRAIVMDSEDDWDHKQLSFAGLADVIREIRVDIGCVMRMPLTKIFGLSAAGFNSGEDDIEVYNGMVESTIRSKSKYQYVKMAKMRCLQLFGFIPSDLTAIFQPLRVMSSEQEENVKEKRFNRVAKAFEQKSITLEEYRDICNKEKLFGIALTKDKLAELEAAKEAEMENAAGDPEGENGKQKPPAKKKNSIKNSAEFDRASYEASGGDGWFDMRRQEFFKNPLNKSLWSACESVSQRAYGMNRFQFVLWLYIKRGGSF